MEKIEKYKKLLELRNSETLKLKGNPYLKPGTVLRYYQIQMVAHLFIMKRFVIGEDCGLGKTAEIIVAYSYLLNQDPELKLLIVSPSSALYQWYSEFDKFTQGISCQIVESVDTKIRRGHVLTSYDSREYQFKQFEDNNKNVLILNYNTMDSDFYLLQELLTKYKFMVVFDEATTFKNPKSHTFFFASQLTSEGSSYYLLLDFPKDRRTLPALTWKDNKLYESIWKNGKIDTIELSDNRKGLTNLTFPSKKIIPLSENQAKIVRTLGGRISPLADRVYGLSATVIKNHLEEAWAIFRVIIPGLFSNITAFKKMYYIQQRIQFGKGGRVIFKTKGYKNLDYFKKQIDPFFLGRKKSDVAKELPEITTKEIYIKMTVSQRELYDDTIKGCIDYNKFTRDNNLLTKWQLSMNNEELDQEDLKYIDKLAALIYCQQICNSPHTVGIDLSSAKEEEFIRIVSEELVDEKIVVYTRFRKMIERLGKLLKEQNINYTWISGELDGLERENNKKRFNESTDCNIILINSAAKEAINLQSSQHLIFIDLPWSYGDFLQIIGRIHRIGNKYKQIFLYYLLCEKSIDEKVYKILNFKKKLFDEILGDSAVGAIRNSEALINTIFKELISN